MEFFAKNQITMKTVRFFEVPNIILFCLSILYSICNCSFFRKHEIQRLYAKIVDGQKTQCLMLALSILTKYITRCKIIWCISISLSNLTQYSFYICMQNIIWSQLGSQIARIAVIQLSGYFLQTIRSEKLSYPHFHEFIAALHFLAHKFIAVDYKFIATKVQGGPVVLSGNAFHANHHRTSQSNLIHLLLRTTNASSL